MSQRVSQAENSIEGSFFQFGRMLQSESMDLSPVSQPLIRTQCHGRFRLESGHGKTPASKNLQMPTRPAACIEQMMASGVGEFLDQECRLLFATGKELVVEGGEFSVDSHG